MGDSRPPHHVGDGRFRNPWPGSVEHGLGSALRWFFDRARKGKFGFRSTGTPPAAVTPHVVDRVTSGECRITWIGHSTFLIQLDGINALTDPVFGDRASPVTFAGPRRLARPGIALDALPPIDLVLQSHDHYDHFDDASVREIARRFPAAVWCAPLGVASQLRARGVQQTIERDWLDSANPLPGVRVICEPARHFAGRSLANRNATLWCGWTLCVGARRIYFVGDSALHPDFAEISRRDGPFDAVLMPIGAYDPRWFMSAVHMNPEEAVDAFVALRSPHRGRAPVMAAMHWGTFVLTDEPVDEPPKRVRAAFEARGLAAESLWVFAPGETRVLLP